MNDQKIDAAPDAETVAAGRAAAEAASALAISKMRLTAKLIPIIAPFLAVDDIRYYLAGVNVRPHPSGGAVICATNGHVLAMMYDRDAICEQEVIIHVDKRAVKACAKMTRDARQLVMLDGRVAIVEGHGEEVYIQPGKPVIAGAQFPRYEAVIKSGEGYTTGLHGHFNAHYVAMVQGVANSMVRANIGDSSRSVTFFTHDKVENAIARVGGAGDFLAILMPMQAKKIDVAIEAWVPRQTTAAVPDATVKP